MPKTKLIRTDPPAVSGAIPGNRQRVTRRAAAAAAATGTAAPATLTPLVGALPAGAPQVATPLGKQAHVLALLQRPAGATIAEMMTATGWMSHSVRGLLSAGIKRKLGLTVTSAVEPERGRVYRVAPPAPVSPPPTPVPAEQAASPTNPPTKTGVRRKRSPGCSEAGAHTDAAG